MSDLFTFLAADDDSHRVAQRRAAAVAHKRVTDRFSAFLANSTPTDRRARLALVEDDIKAVIASVVDEYGGDYDMIETAIMRSLAGAEHLKEFQFKKKDSPDAGDEEAEVENEEAEEEAEAENPKSASLREARRPKMCPYHSEVTDIALGTGDPQAGYNAMSQQAWGDNHCKGGFDGSCNFKPAMVTQQYWDDKKAEYAQRAEQRVERDMPELATEPIMSPEPFADGEGEGVTDIDSELAEAPSAVGDMVFARSAADAPKGAGGAVERESLPSADESGLGGPSPKIDKGTWTGLDPIDTETSGTPHPTVDQDVTEKAKYDKKDFLDQTDTVTEQQDLPSNSGDAGFSDGKENHGPHTDTWTEDNGTDPVTPHALSSFNYERNPIRDIIDSNFGGFLPASDVDAALRDFGE